MTLLTAAAILACADVQTRDVSVPEWGGTVRVKGMTGAERDAFTAAVAQEKASFTAALVAATIVDEANRPLFTKADIAALAEKSAAALERVARVASRLNGIGVDAEAQALGN